jgi:hypothetical protein
LLGLQGFGDAGGTDPACAEAAYVLFALLNGVFIVCEGGEERGGRGAGLVVVLVLVWVAVVRGGTALGGIWGRVGGVVWLIVVWYAV